MRPDSTHGTRGGAVRGAGSAAGSSEGSAAGASSRMVWALVPLAPKEETAARRGRPGSVQGRLAVSRRTLPWLQSTLPEGSSACRLRGSTPCRIAMTTLMIPATPAAAWVWPMFDFTEPSHSGASSGRSCP